MTARLRVLPIWLITLMIALVAPLNISSAARPAQSTTYSYDVPYCGAPDEEPTSTRGVPVDALSSDTSTAVRGAYGDSAPSRPRSTAKPSGATAREWVNGERAEALRTPPTAREHVLRQNGAPSVLARAIVAANTAAKDLLVQWDEDRPDG